MLQKPRDYDTALSYDSDFARLKPGGYVCQIMKMEEKYTANHTLMVVCSFDICEGENKDFYMNQWKRDKARAQSGSDTREVKWGGTYNLFPLTADKLTNPSYKGILTSMEKSNPNFKVNWQGDYDQFTGKKVGLMFREEEYVRNDGSLAVIVRAFAARPVDYINEGNFETPSRRALPEKDYYKLKGPYTGVGALSGTATTAGSGVREADFIPTTIDDDELPF